MRESSFYLEIAESTRQQQEIAKEQQRVDLTDYIRSREGQVQLPPDKSYNDSFQYAKSKSKCNEDDVLDYGYYESAESRYDEHAKEKPKSKWRNPSFPVHVSDRGWQVEEKNRRYGETQQRRPVTLKVQVDDGKAPKRRECAQFGEPHENEDRCGASYWPEVQRGSSRYQEDSFSDIESDSEDEIEESQIELRGNESFDHEVIPGPAVVCQNRLEVIVQELQSSGEISPPSIGQDADEVKQHLECESMGDGYPFTRREAPEDEEHAIDCRRVDQRIIRPIVQQARESLKFLDVEVNQHLERESVGDGYPSTQPEQDFSEIALKPPLQISLESRSLQGLSESQVSALDQLLEVERVKTFDSEEAMGELEIRAPLTRVVVSAVPGYYADRALRGVEAIMRRRPTRVEVQQIVQGDQDASILANLERLVLSKTLSLSEAVNEFARVIDYIPVEVQRQSNLQLAAVTSVFNKRDLMLYGNTELSYESAKFLEPLRSEPLRCLGACNGPGVVV